jgi:hypothetical protein
MDKYLHDYTGQIVGGLMIEAARLRAENENLKAALNAQAEDNARLVDELEKVTPTPDAPKSASVEALEQGAQDMLSDR